MIRWKKTTTGSEPVTLEEMKAWMRVSSTADDTLISSLITEARELIETALNHSIVEQTIELTASGREKLYLPFQPVTDVTTVKDMDGEDLPYEFDGFIISFTSISTSITDYTAGYAAPPEGLLVGLKEVVAFLYENRGDAMNANVQLFIQNNESLGPYNQVSWVA